jgi:hydrocephalus-inducing protein
VIIEPPVQELLAFTAQPERWEIPPHEHRFVNVYFNPTEIKSYRSVFLAEIDDEGIQTSASSEVSNAGKALKFDLGGSGTLPCIGFESPTERAADGSLLINFDKVLLERSSRRSIILRNDGVMPATCLFTLVGHSDFIFSSNGSSLTVPPGEKQEIFATFAPKSIGQDENKSAKIKISVLHNQFDQYNIDLKGIAYTCDAIIDTIIGENDSEDGVKEDGIADEAKSQNEFSFPEINLSDGPGKSSHTIMLKSRSPYPLKFELSAPDSVGNVTFSPSLGHLDQNGRKEVVVTFSASEPIRLEKSVINCTLSRIEYAQEDVVGVSLRGRWDDSMKSYRRAAPEDLAKIEAAAAALSDYKALVEAEAKKGKKAKPVGPPPPRCLLELAKSPSGDGETYVTEIVAEPLNELVANTQPQQLSISCSGTADMVSYSCTGDGDNISFRPTFMFQATAYKFVFTNKCNLTLPIKWTLDDFKRRGTRGGIQSRLSSAKTSTLPAVLCPFSIDSEECEIAPKSEKQFTVKFLPLEAEDFVFLLKGETLVSPLKSQDGSVLDDGGVSVIRMVLRGTGKRPICHFDINETLDYMSRRTSNLKNENGLFSNIEATDFKVVELESVGLQTRNTFRFHVTNPTGDNYEFIWESMGDPSPFWRCVQSAGMMFAGKRIEMVFEYLPEEISVAEAFFKFKIPHLSLEQIFLFTGKVREPNVSFSTSKVDYHSVMLGGEGSSETVYIENKEHLPFNFAFDRQSLLQLEGPHGPVLNINPKSGKLFL